MAKKSQETLCKEAILATLSYRCVFRYPLSFYQICTCLVSAERFNCNVVRNALDNLVSKGLVREVDSLYSLVDVKPVNWHDRFDYSVKLLKENSLAIGLLSKIPWIELISVTGSVAAYNADLNSDLDIFIITQKNRLWLTRFFVVALLKTIGKYPGKGGDGGKICPNLYVDTSCLGWLLPSQNVFTAHEIILMQPVYQRNEAYLRFLRQNTWVHKFIAGFSFDSRLAEVSPVYGSPLVSYLEKVAMSLQMRYMRRKITAEKVSEHVLHFNKNDSAPWILNKYAEILKQNGGV